LRELVDAGKFREDLYYRLAGVEIVVPPLRARRDDIPLLVDHFIARLGRGGAMAVGVEAREALAAYQWPGNVRQLARVMERAVALAPGPVIVVSDLPDDVRRAYGDVVMGELAGGEHASEHSLRAWSSRYVRLVLTRCEGNKRRACDVLDISYHTLQSHLGYESGADILAPPHAAAAELTLAEV
jgi:DNA-binding NtrC family response regulator